MENTKNVRMRGLTPFASRYFTDGMALGSAAFLRQLQADYGEWFPEQRKAGSTKMKGADWGELRLIRNLRVFPLA